MSAVIHLKMAGNFKIICSFFCVEMLLHKNVSLHGKEVQTKIHIKKKSKEGVHSVMLGTFRWKLKKFAT